MTRTKISLVTMGVIAVVLGLLLVIPDNHSENLVASSLHVMSGFSYDSQQYTPVTTFKEKYPNYFIMKQSDYPKGDKYARIVYAYTNSSLYRTEVLSISGDSARPSFTIKCIDENGENFNTLSASLEHFTKQYVDEFQCANHKIDSQTLNGLHTVKEILEQSNFPIKNIEYNYNTQSLEIRLFTLPKDNYEERINKILLENNVDAFIEYQGYGIGRFS